MNSPSADNGHIEHKYLVRGKTIIRTNYKEKERSINNSF